jgi:hypothetical protein
MNELRQNPEFKKKEEISNTQESLLLYRLYFFNQSF